MSIRSEAMQEIPYNLDIDFSRRSNASESSLLRQSICKRCWQDVFDTSMYAEMWVNEHNCAVFAVSFEDLGISTQNGCTWCRLLKRHLDGMTRRSTILDTEARLLVAMNIQRCNDSRITPAGSLEFELAIELPLSSRTLRIGPSPHAQDKNCDEDWTSGSLYQHITFDVFANSSDPAAKIIPTRDIQPVVHSLDAITEVKQWIESCAYHVDCSTTSNVLLPTRVIEVLPLNGKHRSRLLVTNGLKGTYNTLSYCWGTQSTVLTNQNLAQFQQEIDLSTLSKTAQDAIEVTKSLGIQYLWIDAICILQDSSQDKASELSRMASVYQSSHITIVAASAKNADEGFLQPREAPSLANAIPFMHNGFHAGTVNIRRRLKILEVPLEIPPWPSPDPVDRRAWTLQEQLLSERLLVYSTDTLQWRCKGVVANLGNSKCVPQPDQSWWSAPSFNFVRPEPVPLLLNHKAQDVCNGVEDLMHEEVGDNVISTKSSANPPGQQAAEHRRLQKLHTQWTHLIETYSLRSMTYASDKLVALAGIAEKFGEALRTKYIAGFWEDHMLEYLIWHPESGATRTSSYRAPSWSWASLDGGIAFNHDLVTGVDQSCHPAYGCRILRCQITSKNQLLPYGEISGGRVELSAVLRRAWYGDPLEYGELHWLENASAFGKNSAGVSSSILQRFQLQGKGTTNFSVARGSMDIRPSCASTSWYNGEVFCVALWFHLNHPPERFQTVEGLMLTHKETNIYERIGWFTSSAEKFNGYPKQTIIII